MIHPIFQEIRYVILDMDGTFYLSDRLIPGADRFVREMEASGRAVRFFTNNSSNDRRVCGDKLCRMGFPASQEKILLSTDVTIAYLQKQYPGKRVFLLGNERLTADLLSAGISLVEDAPDLVLLGFDTTLNYEKIRKAARFIAGGAVYLATHPDVNCPTADGFMPDAGSMIELFAASTGRRPRIMGKPAGETVDYLTERLACREEELLFIGDRLATDIAIGVGRRCKTVLVLSGATTKEDYDASEIRADLVVDSLASLIP